MKLKNQVCSLGLSKKLEKLGVKQDSFWYWVHGVEGTYNIVLAEMFDGIEPNRTKFSAYTVAELGEILKWKNEIIFGLPEDIKSLLKDKDTEADFRAKMLIYLIKNKLIKL